MSDKKGKDKAVRAAVIDIQICNLELDGSTQARVITDPHTVNEYCAVIMGQGWVFPPVIVFRDKKERNWLGDGFHRVAAAVAAGMENVLCEVRSGSIKDALKFALGANVEHGLRRSSADLKNAVELAAHEFSDLTDRAMADLVKCDPKTVAKYRSAASREGVKTGLDGKQYSEDRLKGGADEMHAANDASVRVAGSESGSVITGDPDAALQYDVDYVELDGRPGIAELHAWVVDVPTWRMLSEGSDIPVKRMKNDCGVPSNMIRRGLVITWCAGCASLGDNQPRWDGFRQRPVSLEHAERERERWRKESRMDAEVVWLRDTADLLRGRIPEDEGLMRHVLSVIGIQVMKHITTEAVMMVSRAAGDDADDYAAKVKDGECDEIDVLSLLIGTELHSRGHEILESTVLDPLVSYLEGYV